jgi:hypothetical protein
MTMFSQEKIRDHLHRMRILACLICFLENTLSLYQIQDRKFGGEGDWVIGLRKLRFNNRK